MPPRPGFAAYFIVSAKEILMHNDHYQSFTRSSNGGIWMDQQTYRALNVTIEDNSQKALFHSFDFDFDLERCVLPAALRQSPVIDRRFLLTMKVPSLSVSLSSAQLHLLLQLFNMNFAYDDKVERLVNEQALPPASVYSDPAHLGVFLEFRLGTGSFCVEMNVNQLKFAKLEFGALEMKLKRYNDFFMQLEVAGEKLQVGLLESSWSIIEQENLYIQHSILATIGNNPHSLLFSMSKAWNSSKNLHISLLQPFFLLDSRLFSAFSAFSAHSFPEYTATSAETPFDYLTKLRPRAEDTFWDLPEAWTAPELKLTIEVKTALLGLQMPTLPIGLGVLVSEVEFRLEKVSEMELRESRNEEKRAVSRVLAVSGVEIVKFERISPAVFPQVPHLSRCSDPISVLWDCWTDSHGAEKSTWNCEGANVLLSLQDAWLAYLLYQAQLTQLPLFPSLPAQEQPPQTRCLGTVEVSVGKSTLLLINQTNLGSFPLIHLLIPSLSFVSHQLPTGYDARLAIYSALKAYNLRQDHWEPVLEPVHSLVSVMRNEAGRQQEVVQVSIAEEDGGVELTLSEGVLDSLCRAGMMWTAQKLARRTGGEVVQVKNCTGYRVLVEYEGVRIPIETGRSQEFEVSSYDEFLALAPHSHCVAVFLELPNGEVVQLPDVSLTKFLVQTLGYHSKKTIQASLTRDSEGRRVLSLQSPLAFLNKTAMDFRLITDTDHLFPLYQNEVCGLPLECGSSLDFVPLQGTRDYSMSVCIADLVKGDVSARQADLTTSQFSLHLHREEKASGLLVQVLAPLLIRNFMPVTVNLSLTSKKQGFTDIILGKGAYYHEHGFSASKGKTKCTIAIPGFALRKPFSVFSRKERNRNQTLELQGSGGVLRVNVELADVGNRRISLYCQTLILNLTYLPLVFYYKNSNPVAGQSIGSDVVFANSSSSIRLSLGDSRKVPFKVKTAGLQSAIDLRLDDGMNYSLAYKVEVSWATPEEYLHTKIVTVAPRFILVNGLQRDVTVRQQGTDQHFYPIQAGERSPIYWTNGELPEDVQVLLGDSAGLLNQCEKWLWSQPFPLALSGAFTILCESEDGEVAYIRISSVVDGISSIFTLEEEPEDQAAYQVLNQSQSLSAAFRQVGEVSFWPLLSPGHSSRFAWRCPKLPQFLELKVLYAGNCPDCPIAMYTTQLSFSKLQGDSLVLLSRSGETGQSAYLRIMHKGGSKTLVLCDSPEDSGPTEVLSVLELALPRLGFSLVANAPSFTTELVYLTLDHVKLTIIRSPLENLYRLQITHIQADNQYLARSDFPVALRSLYQAVPSVQASVVATAPGRFDLPCFKSCNLEVSRLVCKLESPLVQQVLDLWTRLHVTLKTYRKGKLAELFETAGDALTVTPGWTKASEVDKMVYIEQIFIQKIAVEVHFKHVKDPSPCDEESLAWFLTALGTVPINIDGVPIELEGLYMTDLSGTRRQVQQTVQDFYIADAKRSVLKLIGYSDLVGNPLGVLNHFSQADSLRTVLSSTMDLTVGTVSRLSRGLATGLMAVTQGSEAVREHQREKIKFRPKNLLQGMGYGARALLKGVGEGVVGLVVKPIRGAQRSGLGGLLKGSYQGVSGLLARPVVGLLDLGSTTVEGLINGTKKSGGEVRRRYPRAVYDREGTVKEFSALDSAVLYGFFRKRKPRYRLLCVVESMSEAAEHLLVLFVEKLYVFRNGKLDNKVATQHIQCAYDSLDSISLIIGPGTAKELCLPLPQPQDRALLLRKLNKLLAWL